MIQASRSRLQDVTGPVGLADIVGGALMAFADIDGDDTVDFFLSVSREGVASSERAAAHTVEMGAQAAGELAQEAVATPERSAAVEERQLQLWLWDSGARTFRSDPAARWDVPGLTSVLPGDFDFDGVLDCIVGTTDASCGSEGALRLRVCNQSFGCLKESAGGLPLAASQPLAADVNGDMRTDLLAAYAPIASSPHCTAEEGDTCGVAHHDGCCVCGLECDDQGKCIRPSVRAWVNLADGFEVVLPFGNVLPSDTEASGDDESDPLPAASPSLHSGAAPASPPPPTVPPPRQGSWPHVRLAVPNSNANVDLNGDCAADLMLVALPGDAPRGEYSCATLRCQLLVWLHAPCHSSSCDPTAVMWSGAPEVNETLPAGAGQISLTDMDGDGLTDLIFGSQEGGHAIVHVWYAVLGEKPAYCGATIRRQLCSGGESLRFEKRNFTISDGWQFAHVAANSSRPLTFSVADFNLDGFPEVLLPLWAPRTGQDLSNCGAERACVVMLHNDGSMRCDATSELRIFTPAAGASVTGTHRLVPVLVDATMAIFIDLFEDGVWDIIGGYPNGTLSAWRQEPDVPDYFLKMVTAGAACSPAALDDDYDEYFGGRTSNGVGRSVFNLSVPPGLENPNFQQEPLSRGHGKGDDAVREEVSYTRRRLSSAEAGGGLEARNTRVVRREKGSTCARRPARSGFMDGVNQPGVSYQYLTSLPSQWDQLSEGGQWMWDRPKQARSATQLAQSGYSPLLMPYVLLGLGQTSAYVQELWVGIPSGQVRRFPQAVIPNSRLVVIPYPYTEPDMWELRLYLEARQQFFVGAALAGCLLVLGMVVLALELRERMQDAREKKALAPALPL